jgi:hypothetical protein
MNTTVDLPSPGVAVIALEGELDASNYRDLITEGRRVYAEGARTLVLDLAGLSYMASSGIVALHSLALIFEGHEPPDPEEGWQAIHEVSADVIGDHQVDALRIASAAPPIDRVLDRTGLKNLLPVYEDRAAALAAQAGTAETG